MTINKEHILATETTKLNNLILEALKLHHEKHKLVANNPDVIYNDVGKVIPESVRLFTETYLEKLKQILK